MLPLIGLLVAAVLMAFGSLVESNTMFLAASVLLVVCSLLYFKK